MASSFKPFVFVLIQLHGLSFYDFPQTNEDDSFNVHFKGFIDANRDSLFVGLFKIDPRMKPAC